MRRAVSPVLAAVFLLASTRAFACGPFWSATRFSFGDHPDSPATFARGELALVQPTYDYRYLVIAYRQLVGKPLTAEQTAIFADPVREELDGGAVQYVQPQASEEMDPLAARKEWIDERNKVAAPVAKEIEPYRTEQYWSVLNCSADAFRTAARTLHD